MKLIQILLFLMIGTISFSQEICDNGIDDDFDGLIDLQDTTDCFCQSSSVDSSISSLIPNPSFEQRTCCPNAASQLNCVNNWIQATGATPDYLNTCNLTSVGSLPAPPLPLPDGDGYVGFYDDFFAFANSIIYKEYVGTCLTDTMKAGVNYQLEFSLANASGSLTTEVAIFGTTDCANLPFGSLLNTATSLCPTTVTPTDWTLLDIDTVICSSSSWVTGTLNFTPTQNYTALVIGPSCNNSPSGANYYYLDNLILSEASSFIPRVNLEDTGNYCQGNLILKADFDTIPQFFQWYKDSIAILGATDSIYAVPNGGLGNYQVLATYDTICILTEVYVLNTTVIEFDISTLGTCLSGMPTGEISISNISGGTPPYQIQLNTAPFVFDTIFSNLIPGIYTITVRDSTGCERTVTSVIDTFPTPRASFSFDSVCLGLPTSFIDQSTISSGSITDWNWSLPGNPSNSSPNFAFPNPGTFPVSLTVTSNLGCTEATTTNVITYPLPSANFNFTPQELYTFDAQVCFSNLSTGAISYLWDFDFNGPDGTSTQENPCTVQFPSNQDRTYQVLLVAENLFGCFDSSLVSISILDEFLIYIPNAFTPNGDGLNDQLNVIASGIEIFSFQVFNRWGELIFETEDVSLQWDGNYNGTPVQSGVYVYRAVVKGQNREVKELKGHLNVLR